MCNCFLHQSCTSIKWKSISLYHLQCYWVILLVFFFSSILSHIIWLSSFEVFLCLTLSCFWSHFQYIFIHTVDVFYIFFQKCGLALVFLFLSVYWDMLLLKGMETTATNFRLSEMEWFSPPQESPISLFHSFSGKLTKCWFSYALVLISLRYLDDRNMSMRSLNSPTFLPALCHAEAATHAFYWQFLDINSSSVFS